MEMSDYSETIERISSDIKKIMFKRRTFRCHRLNAREVLAIEVTRRSLPLNPRFIVNIPSYSSVHSSLKEASGLSD